MTDREMLIQSYGSAAGNRIADLEEQAEPMMEHSPTERTPIEPHDAWVATGHCPVIHASKAWCNGKRDHTGQHWAPRMGFNGVVSMEGGLYWRTDARP